MSIIPVKTPWVAKKIFPNLVWDMATQHKDVYLTFDDGPTPEITQWVLNTLKDYNAKATFFCIGKNVEAHPHIFKHILNEGHVVGNHSYNHLKGWKTLTENYVSDIEIAQNAFYDQIGNSEFKIRKLFRPPYGKISPKQSKQLIALGYKIIMWDVISFDWNKDLSPEDCLKNVINNTTKGSIVVFHDSFKAAKNMQYALPKVLAFFSERNFSFKTL
ncbi:MAG: polysaccharide deacetylase family protein [Aestuariibaculum sp.]